MLQKSILRVLLFVVTLSVSACTYDADHSRSSQKKATGMEQKCQDLSTTFYDFCKKDTMKAFTAAEELQKILPYVTDPVVMASSLRCLGDCAEQRNQQKKAIEYYRKSLVMLEKKTGKKAEIERASTLMSSGLIYQKNGDLEEAFRFYKKAERLFTNYKMYEKLLGLYPKIGDIYLRNNLDTVRNKEYIQKMEDILPKVSDPECLTEYYVNRANTYFYSNEPDKALEMGQRAVDILLKSPPVNDYLLGTAYYNLGYFHRNLEHLALAESYYRKSLEAYKKTGILYDITDATIRVGGSLYYQQKYEEAEKCLNKGLKMADSIHSEVLKRNAYDVLSYLEFERGNYKKAYNYLDAYVTLHLNILSEQTQKNIDFLQGKYDDERKVDQIAELSRHRKMLYWRGLALFMLCTVVIVSLLYRQRILKNRQKLAEQRLMGLEQEKKLDATQAVLEGETAERARLARDLHDGLGGMLSVIKLNLFDVKKHSLISGDNVERLDRVMDLLDNSMNELRRVAHNMMPESLMRYGLKVALSDFSDSIPPAHFHYYGEEKRMDPNMEAMIYRTVYELVNNALKYAQAGRINIQVVQQEERIAVTVQDDGIGFDTSQMSKGHGLLNIQNRASSYGGSMDLFSQPGQGTEITVEFLLIKSV